MAKPPTSGSSSDNPTRQGRDLLEWQLRSRARAKEKRSARPDPATVDPEKANTLRAVRDALKRQIDSGTLSFRKGGVVLVPLDRVQSREGDGSATNNANIEKKTDSLDKATLSERISSALDPVFGDLDLAQSERAELVDHLSDQIFNRLTKVDEKFSLHGKGQLDEPVEPPIRWKERTKTVRDPQTGAERLQSASGFLEDVYAPWRGILTRNWLRKNDNPLFQALYREHGNVLHPTFDFASKRTPTHDLLDAGDDAVREHLGKFTGAEAVREAARLKSAQRRRN